MAASRNNTTSGSFPSASTTATWNHTVAANATELAVLLYLKNAGSSGGIAGITFNGVALTLAKSQADVGANSSQIWLLPNPSTGTHAIVITFNSSGSPTGNIASIDYIGMATTGQPDAVAGNANTTGASVTQSITTVAPAAWILGVFGVTSGETAAQLPFTGLTQLASISGIGISFGDSNGFVTAGAHSVTGTDSFQNNNMPLCLVSLAVAPFSGSPSLSVMNGASRLATVTKNLTPVGMSLSIMNAAGRLATAARNKTGNVSLTMLNAAGRFMAALDAAPSWILENITPTSWIDEPK